MKQRFKLFGIYSIYWILFFIIARLLFLFYENTLSFELSIKEWFLTFVYGLRMDLSATGYILAIVGIILSFSTFTNGVWINRFLKPLTFLFLIICSSIVIIDLELYKNWGFRMDATPLLYLKKPAEAMASTEVWLSIVLFISIVLLVSIGIFLYNKKIKPIALKINKTKIYAPLIFLVLTGSMILPIRGGVGIAPMNTGMAYFSKTKFANHTAVNVVWNLMHSLVHKNNMKKTYRFMDDKEASQIVNNLNQNTEKTIQVINKQRPNVFILILESFSSKVIGALGGKWDATPRLNELVKEGLLFSNFYANGDRSDKGIVSILSSYPAQPTTSIIKSPSKTQSLPSLFRTFNTIGYETSFYYGGNIDFANMRSYFLNADVKNIISDSDFNPELLDSKWGAHDEHLFDYLLNDLKNENNPFLKVAFTLSSHDPYKVPMKTVFKGKDHATKFLNSVYYTDKCLGNFFDQIKKTPIWDNTLFILVADHGSARPGNSQNHELDKFKIPMLWLGGVLNDSIKTIDKIGGQIDIASTLLNQMNINSHEFTLSNDLLNDKSGFAFYAFNDGFGFISNTDKVIYENIGNALLYSENNSDAELKKGKAYLQTLMNDYLSR
ncbi:MAG: sulfatase-like hydrolase/transferase [Bacteroidales bacterium]|nr:sulfatase-like hydrolase/transferase [Bacteroidales bacterium]